jgi:transposase InsO family protein
MVKSSMDIRLKAVIFYLEKVKTTKDICILFNISSRTLRRWAKNYKDKGVTGLTPLPTIPKKIKHKLPRKSEQRILRLKQKYPSWGARRIKYQFNLAASWRTVHNVIKRHGLLIKIKSKPQPCKRFQRKHVDSMWQGDTFQFRIHDVGKVYVTGFSDDCSRFRIRSKVYLHIGANEAINALQWALRRKRKPREIYLDNGKQFISKDFKKEVAKHKGIKLIFGRPYHPRGRGKIESYHKTLYRDLIKQKKFSSLSHFRRELWKFDYRYNYWRKQEILGWQTPASVYYNKKYFNKNVLNIKKRTNVRSTN